MQRPQHSDRASYTSARRPLSPHGHATRSPRRTRPNPKPIVDVPGLHQAAMQPQGTSVATQPDATRGSGANRNHGERVGALSTAPRDAASTSRSSPTQAPQARAPNATSQHRWGGVYPKPTLLLSVRGCEWGSRPLSSDFHPTAQSRAMRVQVRLAAPGEHRGGFGTCGRGARGNTSPHQDPRPTTRAGNPRPRGGKRRTDSAIPSRQQRHATLSRPRAPHCQALAGAGAVRSIPRPGDSDWPGSGHHYQPG